MGQEAIWDHFQNEGVKSFELGTPRISFLLRKLVVGERVLNIGVGAGALERSALAKGVEMWALDPSMRAIESLRADLQLGDRAQTGYSQDIPFPDDHFDAVVMSEVIEHLDESILEQTFAEVRRVLRPGGRFLGTVPANEDLSNSEVVCPNCSHQFHKWGHVLSFSNRDLASRLSKHFKVDAIGEHHFIDWELVGWGRRFQGLIKKFLSWRRVGTYGVHRNLYFLARKPA